MITYLFSGTSHGEGYKGKISGLPKMRIDVDAVNEQLKLRKCGYGRSTRQQLADEVTVNGVKCGVVDVEGEVDFFVPNFSMENRGEITALRSGHVDVVAKARYKEMSVRQVNELASARSTVCYVVVGAICRQLLQKQGITLSSYVESVGGILNSQKVGLSDEIKNAIDLAKEKGDSLGGCVVVTANGVPMGVGDAFPLEERLDGVIAGALMAIPSVKACEFGIGKEYATLSGVKANDKLKVNGTSIEYETNNCGGIVAGITNGKDVVCRLTVKAVPTVKGVETFDSQTLEKVPAHFERADCSVVENVGIIAENVLATVLANKLIKQNLLK